MRTLYFDCNMGAAGDMIMSSLLELIDNSDDFIERFNKLNIPHVTLKKTSAVRCGITGTHIDVSVNGTSEDEHMHHHHDENSHSHKHDHHHTGMHDIKHILSHIDIPESVRDDALAVYRLIAEAESHAHGKPVEDIHFHEVGTMDAVADVVGTCMLINEIAPEKIIASPICVGYGFVKCAHGTLPVPAPATAHILQDVPIYSGTIESELCTPTGAAILKYFVDEFKQMPLITIEKTGYGMGTKNFDKANCIRAILGSTPDKTDSITELCCNVDDMTGEEIGFATNMLLKHGALEVFTTPVYMKKNRPGILLTCICRNKDKQKFVSLIFKHTSTIGIREHISNRYVLDRQEVTLKTNYGEIRGKKSSGYGVTKTKPEYDDLHKIAEKNDISISDIELI